MHPLYHDFISYLNYKDKEKCIQMVLYQLENGNIDIITLYNEILAPAQYAILCTINQPEICIWEEHVRTSIIRTILECCYLQVVRERDQKYHSAPKGKVAIICPPGELHDIGARIVADYFTLCGYSVIFVGANTPEDDIVNGIRYFQPKFIAISITSHYNLVTALSVVQRIQGLKNLFSFKVILGGQACRGRPETCQQMGADMTLDSFADIQHLSEELD